MDTTAATGKTITAGTTSTPFSDRSPGANVAPVRHVVEQRSEDEEECEAGGDACERRDDRLDRRDHRNLTRRRADEPHGGEAFVAPRRRQPSRRRDQDEHRQQEEHGSASQIHCRSGPLPMGFWQA